MKYLFIPFYIIFLPLLLIHSNAQGHEMHSVAAVENKDKPPLSFIENKGQITDQYGKLRGDIDVKLPAGNLNIFIGGGQLHYQWSVNKAKGKSEKSKPAGGHATGGAVDESAAIETYRMDVVLVGANPGAELVKEEPQNYYESYYLPQTGKDGVAAGSYNRIIYKNVYPHIDWVLYSQNGGLKYDFVVHAGGNAADIKLRYEGAEQLQLQNGAITATTPFGSISDRAPYSYNATSRQDIPSRYILHNDVLGFETGACAGEMVIDPAVSWVTYYGGSGSDYGWFGTTTDAAGNAYLCGNTYSTNNIATTGAWQINISGTVNGYIAKFNQLGQIQWGTYVGGNVRDGFNNIAYDPNGFLYLVGETSSTSGIATAGTQQTVFGGGLTDILLAKFTVTGSRVWCSYYGGTGNDAGAQAGICVDNNGYMYIAGRTIGPGMGTAGSHQPALSGASDGYIAKFTSVGVRVWGTYYGGPDGDYLTDIDFDNNGNIIVAGGSESTTGISTPLSHQPNKLATAPAGVLAKFNMNGQLQWGTYYGGAVSADGLEGVSCDAAGNIYTCGSTTNYTNISTPGSYLANSPALGAYPSGYVVKFNSAGIRQWGSYYGGTNITRFYTVSATPQGNIYVSGETLSPTGIALPGAYQSSLNGGYDAVFIEWNSTGTPTWATYLGGNSSEAGYNTAVSTAGYIYLTGSTTSTTGLATPGAYQTAFGGGSGDEFLAGFKADTIVYIQQQYVDTVFCAGDTFNLNYGVNNNFNTGNVFTVQLSDAIGSFASPVAIGSVTATSAGVIQCVVPAGAAGGSGYRIRIIATSPVRTSVDDGVNIHIKIRPLPINATVNNPVCAGAVITLGVTAATGSSYSWIGPSSFGSLLQNPTITGANNTHNGDYIATAILDGCTAKDTVTVLVKPVPAMPTANNNGPLCPGDTLHLLSSSITTGISYAWTGPVAVPAVQNPDILNVGSVHNGTYNVTAVLNGCASAPASTTVVVKPAPAKPTASSNTPVCTGGALNLFANSITAGVTYSWAGPVGFTSALQNPVIDPVPANGGGKYAVKAILNGCSSQADTTVVVVNTVSYLGAYASPNDTICEGSAVTVVTVPTNGGSSPTFQWYKNGVMIPGATSLNYVIANPQTGDTFYCRMIAGNICNTPITLFSNKIGIKVLPKTPAPTVSISAVPTSPLPGNAATFTATATNAGGLPKYQWLRNGADVAGAIASTWSTSNLNPYDRISVKLTSSEPCPESATAASNEIEVNFPTVINDNRNEGGWNIYPNPNNGNFTIKGKTHNDEVVMLTIINAVGQTVYSESIVPKHQSIDTNLSVKLAAGVYLLKAGSDVLRLVVE